MSEIPAEIQAEIDRVTERLSKGLKIQKVTVSRMIKTPKHGDFYVGFTAGWESTVDDNSDEDAASVSGMTTREAEIAAVIIGLRVDLAAHRQAHAGMAIGDEFYLNKIKALRTRYGNKVIELLSKSDNGGSHE